MKSASSSCARDAVLKVSIHNNLLSVSKTKIILHTQAFSYKFIIAAGQITLLNLILHRNLTII